MTANCVQCVALGQWRATANAAHRQAATHGARLVLSSARGPLVAAKYLLRTVMRAALGDRHDGSDGGGVKRNGGRSGCNGRGGDGRDGSGEAARATPVVAAETAAAATL